MNTSNFGSFHKLIQTSAYVMQNCRLQTHLQKRGSLATKRKEQFVHGLQRRSGNFEDKTTDTNTEMARLK